MSHDDDAMERELRQAADVLDPLPAHLAQMARAAFTWRTVDAELAELVFDSLAETEVATVRGADQPRVLTFRADELVIEVEVGAEDGGRRLVGRVSPAVPAEVEVHHGRGAVTVAVDELGRFAAAGLAPGPLRLRCTPPGATSAVVTDWISA
jgi:hypothetical protein